jgi:hypothetical protein
VCILCSENQRRQELTELNILIIQMILLRAFTRVLLRRMIVSVRLICRVFKGLAYSNCGHTTGYALHGGVHICPARQTVRNLNVQNPRTKIQRRRPVDRTFISVGCSRSGGSRQRRSRRRRSLPASTF